MMLILIAAGIFAMWTIPKESNPDIDFGIINITTIYQGANPTDMDNLVTDKIESAVKDIDSIKKMTSKSAVGMAVTTLELNNDADITQALVDTKDAVDKVDLPEDADDPIVTQVSTDNELMFQILLYGDKDTYKPLYLLQKARKIKEDLEAYDVVNRVDIDAAVGGSAKIKIG
ncbi:MAG: efflux RND transporter permease subunit [bacterium]|nr:efflux RND transporter permease subunit [bacterium]